MADPPPHPAPHPVSRAGPGIGTTDLLLLVMSLIWGINFSVVKYATQSMAPLAFNSVRVSLAAAALVAIVTLTGERWPRRSVFLTLMGLGVLGNGLYQILFVEGVARTRAGDAALVIAATPALIALIGRLKGTEHVTPRGLVGIALSVGGIALVVLGSGTRFSGSSSLAGNAMVLGGSLCWAVYTVYLKPHTHHVGGLPLSAATMLGGMIPLLIVAAPDVAATSWGTVAPGVWGAILYSGLAALVVAYLLWYRGVRLLGPTRTAMYANLQPVIALLVAWATLGEVPGLIQVAGAASIMGGLLLTRT
jgi:drug/metabolite transporter (DMT)-like permease